MMWKSALRFEGWDLNAPAEGSLHKGISLQTPALAENKNKNEDILKAHVTENRKEILYSQHKA